MNKRAYGAAGERAAEAYLLAHGAVLRARNYSCKEGEIDLIVEIDGRIVFVEVKRRSSTRFGTPAQAVDLRKQAHIARAAADYLKAQGLADRSLRFDVVEVTNEGIRHLPAAFMPGNGGF